MENAFRMDNAEGYTQEQLDEFNHELEGIIDDACVEDGSPELEEIIKNFQDEVSKR